jgi:phenylalanyl-tRNA synthetase beta subunit
VPAPGPKRTDHPGGKTIGWIGELHPQLVQEFDFTYAPILFEIEYLPALAAKMPRFERSPGSRECVAISRSSSTRKFL